MRFAYVHISDDTWSVIRMALGVAALVLMAWLYD